MAIILDVYKDLQIKEPLVSLIPANVKHIVIHHSACESCTWQDINMWHKAKGWNCIGYNAFISKKGEVYICRGNNVGAHTQGYNNVTYGICLEGDFNYIQNNDFVSTFEQYKALLLLLEDLKYIYYNASIKLHRDLNNTECPGKHIKLEKILEDLELVHSSILANKKQYINSPDYWIDTTLKGENYNKDYVKRLLYILSQK